MSQTAARTVAVPAHVATRTTSRFALLILAALLAAFVALGIINRVQLIRLTSAPPVGAAIIAVIMATYAACGMVGAAVFLPRRG